MGMLPSHEAMAFIQRTMHENLRKMRENLSLEEIIKKDSWTAKYLGVEEMQEKYHVMNTLSNNTQYVENNNLKESKEMENTELSNITQNEEIREHYFDIEMGITDEWDYSFGRVRVTDMHISKDGKDFRMTVDGQNRTAADIDNLNIHFNNFLKRINKVKDLSEIKGAIKITLEVE